MNQLNQAFDYDKMQYFLHTYVSWGMYCNNNIHNKDDSGKNTWYNTNQSFCSLFRHYEILKHMKFCL